MLSFHEQRKTEYETEQPEPWHQSCSQNTRIGQEGFALITMLGMLGVIVIMATVIVPNMVTSLDTESGETEEQVLNAIGQGSETYLRSTHTWAPSLVSHSPEYTPLDSTTLAQNERLFPRYFAVHPNMSSFSNGAGLAESSLADARILLISNLVADAAPTITNATQFETWWTTDETATPGLHLYRGNLGSLFHKVTLTPLGPGGSYQIDGTTTNSGGGSLASYSRYHLAGTALGLDEGNTYGSPELQFTLTTNVALQFNPDCPTGSRWQVEPGKDCICPLLLGNLALVNPGFETGDLTGWTKTTGGGANRWGAVSSSFFMSAPSGTYFASGEATGSTSSTSNGLYQRIDVSACATQIDAGALSVNLTGVGHGQTEDPYFDTSYLLVQFYDAPTGGSQVGSQVTSNTATGTVWTSLAITSAAIPATTRGIQVYAMGTKSGGNYIDAGVDDIGGKLVWTLPIVNGDFETGDIRGWSTTVDLLGGGAPNQWGATTLSPMMSAPHRGTYFGNSQVAGPVGNGLHSHGIYQRLDVREFETYIDAGSVTLTVNGYGHGEDSQDSSFLRVAFYDAVAGGNQLGSNTDSNTATQTATWTALTINGQVLPVGTRSIELLAIATKGVTGGTYENAGVDDISGYLSLP